MGEVAGWFGKGHGELEMEAAKVAAGCDGVTTLPFLTGERAPHLPHATAGVVGIRPGALGVWTQTKKYRVVYGAGCGNPSNTMVVDAYGTGVDLYTCCEIASCTAYCNRYE